MTEINNFLFQDKALIGLQGEIGCSLVFQKAFLIYENDPPEIQHILLCHPYKQITRYPATQ